jgi:hypothetical protein
VRSAGVIPGIVYVRKSLISPSFVLDDCQFGTSPFAGRRPLPCKAGEEFERKRCKSSKSASGSNDRATICSPVRRLWLALPSSSLRHENRERALAFLREGNANARWSASRGAYGVHPACVSKCTASCIASNKSSATMNGLVFSVSSCRGCDPEDGCPRSPGSGKDIPTRIIRPLLPKSRSPLWPPLCRAHFHVQVVPSTPRSTPALFPQGLRRIKVEFISQDGDYRQTYAPVARRTQAHTCPHSRGRTDLSPIVSGSSVMALLYKCCSDDSAQAAGAIMTSVLVSNSSDRSAERNRPHSSVRSNTDISLVGACASDEGSPNDDCGDAIQAAAIELGARKIASYASESFY